MHLRPRSGPAGRSEARCRREATGEAFPTIPQGVVAFGLGPFQRKGASARQQSGSRAQTTPVAAALTPAHRPGRLSCLAASERYASPPSKTSFDGSPPQGVAVTWLRGTPERAPKRPTVLDCSHEGSNRRGAASLRTRFTVASIASVAGRDRPEIDAPEGASSRCPSAQGRPDEGRTSLPTSVAEWRRMPSVAPRPLRGEAPRADSRGVARTRGKLTRSRPGPPINPPARGGSAAAGCQHLAHGEKGGCRAGTP